MPVAATMQEKLQYVLREIKATAGYGQRELLRLPCADHSNLWQHWQGQGRGATTKPRSNREGVEQVWISSSVCR